MIALFCLLICFDANKPVVVSDFCQLTWREIAELQEMGPDETSHLRLPRKKAILSLRRSFKAHCPRSDIVVTAAKKAKKPRVKQNWVVTRHDTR